MKKRTSKYPILKLFLDRWSPRSYKPKKVSDKHLFSLFEAARWAPSSYNNQPWRFIYTKRDCSNWNNFLDLLVPFNKNWAKNSSALILIISKKRFDFNNKPSRTNNFDTGAAWQNLALQAIKQKMYAHAMEGFDYDKTRIQLRIPNEYDIICMVAVGYKDKKSILPKELQEREFPSDRKSLSKIVMKNKFKKINFPRTYTQH